MAPDLLAAVCAGAGSDAMAFEMVRWRGPEEVVTRWSRDALFRATRAAAGAVAACTAPGDRVIVACPPGPGFAIAFLGCIGAGRIAVPAATPSTTRARDAVRRLSEACGATLVLTVAPEGAPVDLCAPAPEDIAYLQYTSGSTQAPRGAIITHGALAANLAAIGEAWRMGPDDRGVFWLPPFHDMGLVGALLTPVMFGFPATLMHPAAFLQRPARWLELMGARRATFSGAPDFAYDLCVARAADAACDLSSWSVAVNGAEPVRAATLQRFADAFAPCGFRAEAFAPGYGLAESVLFVTARRADSVPWAAKDGVVSCGVPAAGCDVRIVDGEIWVTGPSLASGYWNDPVATEAAFGARLPGDARHWLRTGDLGFLHDGALHVTGRAKDVIIRAGRKVHAADVEAAIAARLGRGRRTAVFAAADGRLVVIHESEGDAALTRHAITDALGADFDLVADVIVLAAPGAVRTTTSGKTARAATRDAWADGRIAPQESHAHRT